MVTTGRFEIERNGEIAYFEHSLSPGVLELIHTEVPKALRHMGLATSFAETALQYARQDSLKVDIVCPTVREYITKHQEYSHLRNALNAAIGALGVRFWARCVGICWARCVGMTTGIPLLCGLAAFCNYKNKPR